MSMVESGVEVVEEAVPGWGEIVRRGTGGEGKREQTGCLKRSWLLLLHWAICRILGLWMCLRYAGQRKEVISVEDPCHQIKEESRTLRING